MSGTYMGDEVASELKKYYEKRFRERGLNRKDLAFQLEKPFGISQSTITSYLTEVMGMKGGYVPEGENRLARLARFSILCKQLGVPTKSKLISLVRQSYPEFNYPPEREEYIDAKYSRTNPRAN